jgi:hypothetical protein
MAYGILADLALVAHAAFLLYLVLGGFLAWRWPRTIWIHLAVAAWGLGSVIVGYDCPLTGVENWARSRAGQDGLDPGGFIEHYLTGVVYPAERLLLVQALAGGVVAVSWLGFWRRRRTRRRTPAGSVSR